ncbi:16S rRNA (cytosine(967)-C(5))-methyltransferase RsmB [Lysobacter enzymogenes]|nr:16S rRNA (cytosine(967)-C(5))-methyltransferase RsmB [Lysobacter enzymogenes]
MSERRDPPKPGSSKPAAPLDGEARPTAGRLRKLDSLDAARYAPAPERPAAAPGRSGEQDPQRTSAARRERRERAAAREVAGRERNPRSDGARGAGPRSNGLRGDGPRSNDARGDGARSDNRHSPGARGSGPRSAARSPDQRDAAPRGDGRSAGERRRDGAARTGDKPRPPGARDRGREPGAEPYARFRTEHPAAPPLPADDGHPGARVRAIAARTLDAVLHRGRSLKAELATALPALADSRDRALVEAICFAVLRQPLRMEAALNEWMPRPLPPRDSELRALLLAGLAQLDPMQLPAHAALDATVQAARLLGRAHQAGLVNALLRRAQRDGLPAVDPRHSHWPSWLRGMLRKDWPERYDEILAQSAVEPPMWLRVNRAQNARDNYMQRLAEAGIAASASDGLADALRLDEPRAVAALPGFADGAVSVQDASAQRVADALAPAPGARVLDACAAPGGKSAHLLERDGSLRLTALDVDAARLQRVRATLARAGFDDGRAQLQAADAADLDAWWDGAPFDAVLLDAPCSATGIVRRQPDVVLHRRESDIAALSLVQARLLDALWRTLAPGGVLVYATCSILKAENEDQVRAFLARTDDARIDPLGPAFGHDREVGRQRLPGEDGGDGFFYARLRRAG